MGACVENAWQRPDSRYHGEYTRERYRTRWVRHSGISLAGANPDGIDSKPTPPALPPPSNLGGGYLVGKTRQVSKFIATARSMAQLHGPPPRSRGSSETSSSFHRARLRLPRVPGCRGCTQRCRRTRWCSPPCSRSRPQSPALGRAGAFIEIAVDYRTSYRGFMRSCASRLPSSSNVSLPLPFANFRCAYRGDSGQASSRAKSTGFSGAEAVPFRGRMPPHREGLSRAWPRG